MQCIAESLNWKIYPANGINLSNLWTPIVRQIFGTKHRFRALRGRKIPPSVSSPLPNQGYFDYCNRSWMQAPRWRMGWFILFCMIFLFAPTLLWSNLSQSSWNILRLTHPIYTAALAVAAAAAARNGLFRYAPVLLPSFSTRGETTHCGKVYCFVKNPSFFPSFIVRLSQPWSFRTILRLGPVEKFPPNSAPRTGNAIFPLAHSLPVGVGRFFPYAALRLRFPFYTRVNIPLWLKGKSENSSTAPPLDRSLYLRHHHCTVCTKCWSTKNSFRLSLSFISSMLQWIQEKLWNQCQCRRWTTDTTATVAAAEIGNLLRARKVGTVMLRAGGRC